MRIDLNHTLVCHALISFALAVLAGTVFLAGLRLSGPYLSWNSKNYAQLGRQLARGEGRTTKLLVWDLLPRVTSGRMEKSEIGN